MPNMIRLKARTLTSKKAFREIVAAYPKAKKATKKYVPGVGYALYIKDAAGNTIAHLTKDIKGLVLNGAG